MAYYVGLVYGQQPLTADDSEGGSAPTADVYIAIGTGNTPVGQLSRSSVLAMIEQLKQYVASDAPPNGSNLLSSLLP